MLHTFGMGGGGGCDGTAGGGDADGNPVIVALFTVLANWQTSSSPNRPHT